MKIKRLSSLILIFSLCATFGIGATNVVSGSSYNENSVSELYALGVLDQSTVNENAFVTRAEMVKMAVCLLGTKIPNTSMATDFTDVLADNSMAPYINFAVSSGIISKNDTNLFNPDKKVLYEEAVKMLVSLLNYDEYAQIKGGYPLGHIMVANEIGLLKGVGGQAGSSIMMSDVVTMLRNALDVPLLKVNIELSPNGEINYSYERETDKTETLLHRNFRVNVYGVFVSDIKNNTHAISFDVVSSKNNGVYAGLELNKSYTLAVSDKIEIDNFRDTYSDIWVNSDNEIISIGLYKNLTIVNGYIDEINKEAQRGVEHDPKYIDNIAILGTDDYMYVNTNCRYYYNGNVVKSGGVPFVGSYARVVIYKDEVISIEAWGLKEGGIISSVTDDGIKYNQAVRRDIMLDGISEFASQTILINGERMPFIGILPDMTFDYYADENKKNIIIVASSRAITDVLTSMSSQQVEIGGIFYDRSQVFGVHCAIDGVNYIYPNNIADMLDKTVTAYLDAAGFVRYIKTLFYNEDESEFYGLVSGYHKSENGMSKDQLQLFRLYSGNTIQKIYDISNKVSLEAPITFLSISEELAKLSISTIKDDVGANTALANVNLLYKFKLNKKGEISSIKNVIAFDSYPITAKITVTSFVADANAYIPTPLIYFNGAKILGYYYEHGTLKTKIVPWNKIMSTTGSVTVNFYRTPNTSDIDLVLVRGGVLSLALGRTEDLKFGILTHKTTILNSDDGVKFVKIMVGGQNYIVEESVIKDIPLFSYLSIATDTVFSESELVVKTAFDISDRDPDNWSATSLVSGTATAKLNRGIITAIDKTRISFDVQTVQPDKTIKTEQVKNYMATDSEFSVYKISDNSNIGFDQNTLSDLCVGMEVWYVTTNQTKITAVFYK